MVGVFEQTSIKTLLGRHIKNSMQALLLCIYVQRILGIVFLANKDWTLLNESMTYDSSSSDFVSSPQPIIWIVQAYTADEYCVVIPRQVSLQCNGVSDNARVNMSASEWAVFVNEFLWRFDAPLRMLNCSGATIENGAVSAVGIPMVVPCIDLGAEEPQIRLGEHANRAAIIAVCAFLFIIILGVCAYGKKKRNRD